MGARTQLTVFAMVRCRLRVESKWILLELKMEICVKLPLPNDCIGDGCQSWSCDPLFSVVLI